MSLRMLRALGLACACLLLATSCFQPSDRRPGFALRGERAESLPEDWSFSDAHGEIAVQVATPYLIPHSVTIWCASADGDLYLGARDPEAKNWPVWVEDHPEVRLKIGETLYDVRLEPVEDEDVLARVRAAYAAKYDLPAPGPDAPTVRYWRVRPRG